MSAPLIVPNREQRFADLYDTAYADVLRFVQRRSAVDVAEDITHEAFLVAWRRFDNIPATTDSARAWLFGVARNCLLSDRRSRERYELLGVRIAGTMTTPEDQGTEAVSIRLDLIAAWQRLSTTQQEVLSLALWEELPATAAGRVLGISAAAYRIRLHRARNALRGNLDTTPTPAPSPAMTSEMTA